jgi:hypothetical protein
VVALLTFGGWLRGRDQWGPFRGQIVDAETGAPIANAHVMVTWFASRPNLVDSVSDFYDARETVSDAQGRFELPRLWRLWTLWVMAPTLEYFAPGYLTHRYEVVALDGEPYAGSTIVRLRPIKTREERCTERPYTPMHDSAPMFRQAVLAYWRGLDC